MQTYKVKVSYTFEGIVEVKADNKGQAKHIVSESFGMVAGQVSCSRISPIGSNNEGIIDWEISTHPDITIIK